MNLLKRLYHLLLQSRVGCGGIHRVLHECALLGPGALAVDVAGQVPTFLEECVGPRARRLSIFNVGKTPRVLWRLDEPACDVQHVPAHSVTNNHLEKGEAYGSLRAHAAEDRQASNTRARARCWATLCGSLAESGRKRRKWMNGKLVDENKG